MMKNIFSRVAVLFAAALVLLSCGNGKEEDDPGISGEWKLESVGGIAADELFKDEIGGLDRYVCFTQDGMFETFERLVDGNIYLRYDGTYSLSGVTASGVYSDGSSWGASYTVKIEEGGDVLVMSAEGEDCVYRKAGVPADVRSQAIDAVSLKSVSDTALSGKFL